MAKEKNPVLYVCPYCKKGFRDRDRGFRSAKVHIMLKHYGAVMSTSDWKAKAAGAAG